MTSSHKLVKLVKSCINSWMDLQVDLSELVAAHLVYINLNVHGHSFHIQYDISILLKGIENCKSQVMATLPRGLLTPCNTQSMCYFYSRGDRCVVALVWPGDVMQGHDKMCDILAILTR